MRSIKFRGKRISDGKWVYGDLLQGPRMSISHRDDKRGWVYDVDPETVGQYTGMNDPNGVEIYEGDIVYSSQLDFAEVIFESPAFYAIGHQCNACMLLHDKDCVNGNIYENPELLTAEPWKH